MFWDETYYVDRVLIPCGKILCNHNTKGEVIVKSIEITNKRKKRRKLKKFCELN